MRWKWYNKFMKKGLVVVVVILIVAVVGYFAYKFVKEKGLPGGLPFSLGGAENDGGASQINTNPLGEVPEINPVDKTNPFKDVRTNPFE